VTSEDDDEGGLIVIARRLFRSGARAVGFLPVRGAADHFGLMVDLAAKLALYAGAPVGCLRSWRAWKREAGGIGRTPVEDVPDVVVLEPTACTDLGMAARTAEQLCGQTPPSLGVTRLLVDLAGYARPGDLTSVVGPLDGVVLLVDARRNLRRTVTRMADAIPHPKYLGPILLG